MVSDLYAKVLHLIHLAEQRRRAQAETLKGETDSIDLAQGSIKLVSRRSSTAAAELKRTDTKNLAQLREELAERRAAAPAASAAS